MAKKKAKKKNDEEVNDEVVEKKDPARKRDIRDCRIITDDLHKDVKDYLSNQPYNEVAGLIVRLDAAITRKLEVIHDDQS